MILTRRQLNRISDELDALTNEEPCAALEEVEWPYMPAPEGCEGAVQVHLGERRLLIAKDGRVLNAGAVLAAVPDKPGGAA